MNTEPTERHGKIVLIDNGRRAFAPWHELQCGAVVIYDQMHLFTPRLTSDVDAIVSQLPKDLLDRQIIVRDHETRYWQLFASTSSLKNLRTYDLIAALALLKAP